MTLGVSTNECPTSLITAESNELVQLFFRMKALKKVGVSGMRSGDLPIKLADAFVILRGEENRVLNALNEQEQLDVRSS